MSTFTDQSILSFPSPGVRRYMVTGPVDLLVGGEARVPFRVAYLRMHFTRASGLADVVLSLDSVAGDEYDVLLYTEEDCGLGADLNLNLRAGQGDYAWSFAVGDRLRIVWNGPAAAVSGIEVGYLT